MHIRAAMAIIVACGGAAQAGSGLSEADAVRQILSKALLTNFPAAARIKTEPASIYVRPYLPSDTRAEKQARKAWYSAQLPARFPTTGDVRVIYLHTCSFPAYYFPSEDKSDATEAYRSLADQVWVRDALAAAGVSDVDVSQISGRETNGRRAPIAAMLAINETLLAARTEGRTAKHFAVFEPFCGPSERDPAVYPAPAPPPPPPSPIFLNRPANLELYLNNGFRSELCRLQTGSSYDLACKGWYRLHGPAARFSGNIYHYVLKSGAEVRKAGKLDLEIESNPIQLYP